MNGSEQATPAAIRELIQQGLRAMFRAQMRFNKDPETGGDIAGTAEGVTQQWAETEACFTKALERLPPPSPNAQSRYGDNGRRLFDRTFDDVRDSQRFVSDAPELTAVELCLALANLPALRDASLWWFTEEGFAETAKLEAGWKAYHASNGASAHAARSSSRG